MLQVTGRGYYVQFREPWRFHGGYRRFPDLPGDIQARVSSVCPRARVDVGRLTPSAPWRVALVYLPHESLPFGEPEAVEFAERIRASVEARA